MTGPRALLIFDGECVYCRAFARLLRLVDRRGRFIQLPFGAPDAQRLLRAQFGADVGFAMYLIEPSRIHWGARAAERVTALMSAPAWLARVALLSYPTLVSVVSRLTRRQRAVCGPGCAMGTATAANDHGNAALTDAACTLFAALAQTDAGATSSDPSGA